MFDLQLILTFSHTYCIAICTVLVPCNLLATLHTLIRVGLRQNRPQTLQSAILALLPALLMVLHVLSWLIVGVVMAPTYILLGLGFTCFCLNGWAIVHPTSLSALLRGLFLRVRTLALTMMQTPPQESDLKF
jgi:hypothetical protein